MFQQRDWGIHIGHNIARRLQSEGCRLTAITLKKSVDTFTRTQTEVEYDKVVSHDQFWGEPYAVPGVTDITLADVCNDLEIDSIWPIAATERHYVRDYSEHMSFTFRQYRSDRDIETYIKATYITIRDLMDTYPPDLIVGLNFVATYQLIAHRLAKKRNIPIIGISSTRIAGRHIFVNDPYYSQSRFFEYLERLNSGAKNAENPEQSKNYIAEFRREYRRPPEEVRLLPAASRKSPKRWLKDELRPWWHAFKSIGSRPENKVTNIGATPDAQTWRIILRDFYSARWNRWVVDRLNYSTLAGIDNYAYFPLQAQPEAQIDTISTYVSNQIETARLIAQSLPDDLTLIVKEHPFMLGQRKKSYYEKLLRTPNVKLVGPETSVRDILQNARCVIGAGGTTMVEAAYYHIPAIQFGNLGLTKSLPNVFPHSDFTTLSNKIKDSLTTELETPEYEQQLENYVSSAFDIGFEVDYLGAKWGRSPELETLVNKYVEECQLILNSRPSPV